MLGDLFRLGMFFYYYYYYYLVTSFTLWFLGDWGAGCFFFLRVLGGAVGMVFWGVVGVGRAVEEGIYLVVTYWVVVGLVDYYYYYNRSSRLYVSREGIV